MQSRRSQRCDFWPTRQSAKYLPTSRTFCTTPLPRCFLERRKSRTLASQSNLPGEQCSPLLSPADPQNSLRQKPCRRTCGGDGCCATPRATVSSLVCAERAHERPQGASSDARWSSTHPRRSKCNAEVDSECKFARTARDNAPWQILASHSNPCGRAMLSPTCTCKRLMHSKTYSPETSLLWRCHTRRIKGLL